MHNVSNTEVNFYRWNEKENVTQTGKCSNTNDPHVAANYFCRSFYGWGFKAISYKRGTYKESGAARYVMHMGIGCFKGHGSRVDNTTCSKDPDKYDHQECKIQNCKKKQSKNDPSCQATVKGLYDIICSIGMLNINKVMAKTWFNSFTLSY